MQQKCVLGAKIETKMAIAVVLWCKSVVNCDGENDSAQNTISSRVWRVWTLSTLLRNRNSNVCYNRTAIVIFFLLSFIYFLEG